jgi:hypothetical protein
MQKDSCRDTALYPGEAVTVPGAVHLCCESSRTPFYDTIN